MTPQMQFRQDLLDAVLKLRASTLASDEQLSAVMYDGPLMLAKFVKCFVADEAVYSEAADLMRNVMLESFDAP